MKTEAIPKGFHTLNMYISVVNAVEAIEFYKKAFGAKEVGRVTMPDGKIAHAELDFGDSRLMLAEENKEWGNVSPQTLGGTPVAFCLYVDDVDKVFDTALKHGAQVLRDMVVKDQYYGDRTGTLTDPFGYTWSIMTHIQDVSFEELQKKTEEMFKTA